MVGFVGRGAVFSHAERYRWCFFSSLFLSMGVRNWKPTGWEPLVNFLLFGFLLYIVELLKAGSFVRNVTGHSIVLEELG